MVSVLPILICLGPAAGLIGFVVLMIGIASKQPKMWKWGTGILITDALLVLVYLLVSLISAR